MLKQLSIFTVTLTLLLLALPLKAKDSFKSQWLACKKIVDNPSRLACYDALSITTGKADKILAKKSQDFGLEHKKSLENAESSIQTKVVKVSKSVYGQLKVVLENGQRWKQTDEKRLKLKIGDHVTIIRGALGAFYLKKVGKTGTIKVKREK